MGKTVSKYVKLHKVVISNLKKNESSIKGENAKGASLSRVNGQGSAFGKGILDKTLKAMKGVSHANMWEIMSFEALSFG